MDFAHSHPLRYPSRLQHFFPKSFHYGLGLHDVIDEDVSDLLLSSSAAAAAAAATLAMCDEDASPFALNDGGVE